jgi:hypothetical protein
MRVGLNCTSSDIDGVLDRRSPKRGAVCKCAVLPTYVIPETVTGQVDKLDVRDFRLLPQRK